MRTYTNLSEECTWREVYDVIQETTTNLNEVDYLYKSYLGDGQVFDAAGNVGYVNQQEAYRNTNITITSDDIANFKISGFQWYYRKENKIIDIDINCNLYQYRDNKPHFLYIVMSQHGTYEVHDTMFENTENICLFARFIIDTDGNSIQFYVIAPFAGSPDYIKGNTFYVVSEGLDMIFYNKATKQFTIPETKIRFSGICFDNYTSPDVLHIIPEDTNIKFKYIYWDSEDLIPRVDWSDNTAYNTLQLNKIMNYETGVISDVPEGKFTCQKIYYDIYQNIFVAMYGNRYYDTMLDNVLNVDNVLDYPKPDGIDYMLPIAAVLAQNTSSAFDNTNFRIIGLKYNETELYDNDDVARQQAYEALQKAEQAITIANGAVTSVNNHKNDRTNPHQVTKTQVGLGNVENYGIATQSEAEAAMINTKYMTPLRTMNTIEKNSIVSDGDIILKISDVEPNTVAGKTVIWIDTNELD